MLFTKKYFSWVLVVLLLIYIFVFYALQENVYITSIEDVHEISVDTDGVISFLSYDQTLSLIEQKEKRRASYIQGKLSLPDSNVEKLPAAILLHGSLGLSDIQRRYAIELNKIGVATFALDSFAPRNIKDTVGHQSRVTFNSMIQDAFSALRILQNHPRIDPSRIAVIGWSKGGYAAHQTGSEYYNNFLHDKSMPPFAAHVAIYPWCGEQDLNLLRTFKPTLFIVAAEDKWVGSDACVSYADRLNKMDQHVDLKLYEGVGHGFDYPGQYKTYLPDGVNRSKCEYLVKDSGFILARKYKVLQWSRYQHYLHECSSKGVYLESNAIAKQKAMQDVLHFLEKTIL